MEPGAAVGGVQSGASCRNCQVIVPSCRLVSGGSLGTSEHPAPTSRRRDGGRIRGGRGLSGLSLQRETGDPALPSAPRPAPGGPRRLTCRCSAQPPQAGSLAASRAPMRPGKHTRGGAALGSAGQKWVWGFPLRGVPSRAWKTVPCRSGGRWAAAKHARSGRPWRGVARRRLPLARLRGAAGCQRRGPQRRQPRPPSAASRAAAAAPLRAPPAPIGRPRLPGPLSVPS